MPVEISQFLPREDQRYAKEHLIAIEPLCEGKQKAIVLRRFGLPKDRFQVEAADILVLLPPAYPDSPPDMFYVFPWLTLIPGGRYPEAADQPHLYGGIRWQRWSRHNNEWRPGIDGIRTFMQRISTALRIAK